MVEGIVSRLHHLHQLPSLHAIILQNLSKFFIKVNATVEFCAERLILPLRHFGTSWLSSSLVTHPR